LTIIRTSTQKNKKDFEEWIEVVQKDRKMTSIADNNLMRS